MRNASGNNRMTEGSIAGQLVRFAAPLFIGNLFQQLYNTADALIVGNLIGSEALAAVSATGTLVFLLVGMKLLTVRSAEHNGRLRKYYHITPQGLQRLESFKADWKELLAIYQYIVGEDEGHDER